MSAAMMSADPTPIIAVLDIQPTYSAREAAVLLGRSYSWLDQRLRQDQFIRPDGTTVQPLRTQGGYRRFTLAMLEDIALSSYRHHWCSMNKLKSTYGELLMAAHRGPASTKSRAECLLMGSSWLRSAFTCQPPRTADSGLWDGEPQPGAENHQGWRGHVVSSRRANQYV